MLDPRQIFVLTDQGDPGVGSGKTEPLGYGGGKCGARVVVAADNRVKANACEFGENCFHLVERVGGEIRIARDVADQVFEARAGIVVKEVLDAGRGDERKLAIVAMGGADDEDDPICFHRSSARVGCVPAVASHHRRIFRPETGRGRFLAGARRAGLIGASDLASVAARPTHFTLKPMPLHFGKIGAAIALLTVAAFVLWLIVTTLFTTEQAEQQIERTGAVELDGGLAS